MPHGCHARAASAAASCGAKWRRPQCALLPRPSHRIDHANSRNLGGSGLRVSAVGLGCNNFGQRTDLETSRKVIHKAINLGITLFDTADIYAGIGGSETVLGTVLGDRPDIVSAIKCSKAA